MLIELWKEKSLNLYLDVFQIKSKIFTLLRVIYAIILSLIATTIILILGKKILLLAIPVFFLVGFKYPYFKLLMTKRKDDLLKSFAFPEFLSDFKILLGTNGNVYQTIKACLKYSKEPIKSELKKLSKNIETTNSRDVYQNFAQYIGTSEAIMIMDMIYEFSVEGVRKESLITFEKYIDRLKNNKTHELVTKKVASMDINGFYPILISVFFFFSFLIIVLYGYLRDAGSLFNLPF